MSQHARPSLKQQAEDKAIAAQQKKAQKSAAQQLRAAQKEAARKQREEKKAAAAAAKDAASRNKADESLQAQETQHLPKQQSLPEDGNQNARANWAQSAREQHLQREKDTAKAFSPTYTMPETVRPVSTKHVKNKKKRNRKRNRNVDIPRDGMAPTSMKAVKVHRKSSKGHIFLRVLGILLTLAALLAVIGLGVLSANEYRPKASSSIDIKQKNSSSAAIGQEISLLSWNVGYCGLSDNADFFLDGGKDVYASSEDLVNANLYNIETILQQQDADVIFLQEVDQDSTRSYHINESAGITTALDSAGYSSAFAIDYSALFVPYPFPPLGGVLSGIQTESKFGAGSAERVSLSTGGTWPTSTCTMKNCLLVERVPIENSNQQLVLINVHLDAFSGNSTRQTQTEELMNLIRHEYEKGNYVVAGGDFNESFSNTDTSSYPQQGNTWQPGMLQVEDYQQDRLQFFMDSSIPSCRSLDRPYSVRDNSFQYYVIDGFIVTDNVQVQEVKTLDEGFKYSDHNPTSLKFTLLPKNQTVSGQH